MTPWSPVSAGLGSFGQLQFSFPCLLLYCWRRPQPSWKPLQPGRPECGHAQSLAGWLGSLPRHGCCDSAQQPSCGSCIFHYPTGCCPGHRQRPVWPGEFSRSQKYHHESSPSQQPSCQTVLVSVDLLPALVILFWKWRTTYWTKQFMNSPSFSEASIGPGSSSSIGTNRPEFISRKDQIFMAPCPFLLVDPDQSTSTDLPSTDNGLSHDAVCMAPSGTLIHHGIQVGCAWRFIWRYQQSTSHEPEVSSVSFPLLKLWQLGGLPSNHQNQRYAKHVLHVAKCKEINKEKKLELKKI